MSERLTECNKCGTTEYFITLKEINPKTTDMNMDVLLKCKKCGHEDIYKVASYHYKKLRKRGIIR